MWYFNNRCNKHLEEYFIFFLNSFSSVVFREREKKDLNIVSVKEKQTHNVNKAPRYSNGLRSHKFNFSSRQI